MSVSYHSSSNITDASFSGNANLDCIITTGTSKTLKIDVSTTNDTAISLHNGTGPQFRVVYTDRNAYGTAYGAGNAVTVKNISKSDISMHTGNKKLSFSITDDKLVDGATTGVQVTYMVNSSGAENAASTTSAKFNSTPASTDGSNVLVNG